MFLEVKNLNRPTGPPYGGRSSRTKWVKYVAMPFLACALFYAAQLQLAQLARAVDSKSQSRSSGAVRAYAAFQARGTNGFRIYVTGSSTGVRLVAARRHEAAIYLDRRGFANQDGVRASFGKLGEIDLRFHVLSTARRTSGQSADWTGCRSTPKDKYGYFTGTVAFRGEEGFTKIRRHRVYGRAAPAQSLKCIAGSTRLSSRSVEKNNSKNQPELSMTSLYPFRAFIAGGEAITEIVSLVRSGVPLNLANLPAKGVPFRAQVFEERGALLITRILIAKGADTSFVAGPYKSVTVTPPEPFSGEGEYHGCATRSVAEWRGSVKASLPGLSGITYGGNRFDFGFKPGERCPPDK